MWLPLGGSTGVGFAVAGAAPVAGSVQGDSVTYQNVLPGSDIQFSAGAGMVQEQIILHSAAAPEKWLFPLHLAGLTAKRGPGGIITFVTSAGTVIAYVPHGSMSDSRTNPKSGDGASSDGVSYTLTTVAGNQAIVMHLDRAWLHASARVYPVTVDPSVRAINSGSTTFVDSTSSADNSGSPEIHVGTFNGGSEIDLGLMKFDVSSLADDTVLGVGLGLFNSWSFSCTPRPLYVYPVQQSWSVPGSITWPGPAIGKSVGSRSFATGWVPLGSTVSPCPASWEQIKLNQAGTNLVDGWTQGTTPNYGLALGASQSDSYGWKKFTSVNNPTGQPFLTITYTPVGAAYKLADTRPVTPVTPEHAGSFAVTVTNQGSATWTPSNGYEMSYEAYNSKGSLVANHPVFTPMPSSIAPGQSATVDVAVNALPQGSYAVDFDMYSSANTMSPVSFVSQGIAPFAMGLYVVEPPPSITTVYPPSGYQSPTNDPQLSVTASTGASPQYNFSLFCQPLPGTTCSGGTISSGNITKNYWTPPGLVWNEPYSWTVTVTTTGGTATQSGMVFTPEVPQPAVTSRLGSVSGEAFDPQTGDYTTSATEAAVAVPGPALQILRTYNSLNPTATGAFGIGWSSVLDMKLAADVPASSSSMLVTMPDGTQLRFGYSGSSTYVAPFGSSDSLVHNTGGTWSLMVPGGVIYTFTSALALSSITDPGGLAQSFTENGAGEITTITDVASGRTLTITWSTATPAHVTSVTTNAVSSGQPGLQWSYSYASDELTQVCPPTTECTSYSYGTSVSHFPTAVMDSQPRSYYRLGDTSGASTARDQVDVNLGTTDGTYSSSGVTLGGAGPLAGSTETSAKFNGSTGYATLAPDLISDSTSVTLGLWFKAASGKDGVLFGYQNGAIGTEPAKYTPALYIGTDGKLRGEFWNGSGNPITTTAAVTDGKWHYAVLAAAGNTQSLYLDGQLINSMSGTINQIDETVDGVGAGEWRSWPDDTTSVTGYFTGSIAEVAVYPQTLSAATIAQQYALAITASPELTQVTLPSGNVSEQASYNTASDRLMTYTDPEGGQWTISAPIATGYKASSEDEGQVTRTVTVADPAGRDEVYYYDALSGGRLIGYNRGAGGEPRLFGYDQAGCLDSISDEDYATSGGSSAVTLTNDASCNVVARTWTDTTGCAPTGECTTYYSYYTNPGNPADPRDNQVTAVRDARSSSATDNTYLTSYAYNSAGELLSSVTPATSGYPSGRMTSYAYTTVTTAAFGGGTTPAGLLASQSTPGGAVTAYSYYSNGDLGQVTQPSGQRTVYAYDAIGRAVSSTTYSTEYPAGLTSSYVYNAIGEPLSVSFPGVTNSLTHVTHTLLNSYQYDDDGNLTALVQTDSTGGGPSRTTSYGYDDQGNLITVTDPAGDSTSYDYDSSGNVISKTDADGNEYDYTYNEYGNVTSVTLVTNSTSQASPAPAGSVLLASYAYDPAGLLATATDAMGRVTSYGYDPGEELIAVNQTDTTVSPTVGRQTSYGYDDAGNLISTTASGLSGGLITASSLTDYTVNAADQVTSQVVDPLGIDRTVSYTYDPDNHPTSVTTSSPAGTSEVSYTYDSAGDMTSRTVADGSASLETTWTFGQRGLPLTMVTPLGNAPGGNPASYTTSYTYDQNGNLSSVTGPAVPVQTYTDQVPVATQPVIQYGYDTFGDQTQVEDPNGNITSYGYDGDARVTSVTRPQYTPPGSSTPLTAVTSYAYNGLDQLTSSTDSAGNTTSYTYDALGDLTGQTDPQLTGQSAPGQWAWTYDAAGEELSATDPSGAQSQFTWDYFGEQHTTTQDVRGTSQPSGTTTLGYDYLGDRTSTKTPDGVTRTATYDAAGEMITSGDGAGNTTQYSYNQLGEIASVTLPDQTSQVYSYDPAGNLTGLAQYGPPPSPVELDSQSFGYDANGDETSATDGRGYTTTGTYDASGQLASLTQPITSSSSDTTSFGYDAVGNQTAVANGDGNTTWTTYNTWNQAESVIEPITPTAPDGSTWTTGYDADGRPATVSQPGGSTVTYSYDQLGDLTQQAGSGAQAATPTENYGYDLDGRLTSATAPGGIDTFSWNDAGNLIATAGPSGTSSFTYNADGLLASRADQAGLTGYTYDSADRLGTVADPLSAATITYGYNLDDQPTTMSYATSAGAGPVQTLTYNNLHQQTGQTLTAAGGGTIASASYGYDADGNLTSQATTGMAGAGSTTFGYDQADWLTSATTGGTTTAFGYDQAGNLTSAGSTTFSYNAASQPTSSVSSSGTTSYSYDPAGNLTGITPPTGPSQSFTSNAYGQAATAATSAGTTDYSYDGLGRLVTATTGAVATDFTYSGAGSTVASDGTTSYTYDPAGDPVGLKIGSGTAQAVGTDPHGDLSDTFVPAPGTTTLSSSEAYTPYGSVSASSGMLPSLGFQDQYSDPGTGNTMMGARWYDPATGAFTSGDTITGVPAPYAINPSLYGYAADNPLTTTDPTGHLLEPVGNGQVTLSQDVIDAWANPVVDETAGLSIGEMVGIGLDTLGAFVGGVSMVLLGPSGGLVGPCQDEVNCGLPYEAGGENTNPWNNDGDLADEMSPAGGPCPAACYALYYTPPPPPPPQDIYALGVDAPTSPKWMRTDKIITDLVGNNRDAGELLKRGTHIIEQIQASDLTPSGVSTTAVTSTSSTNVVLLEQDLQGAGNPVTPTAPNPSPIPPVLTAQADRGKTKTVLEANLGKKNLRGSQSSQASGLGLRTDQAYGSGGRGHGGPGLPTLNGCFKPEGNSGEPQLPASISEFAAEPENVISLAHSTEDLGSLLGKLFERPAQTSPTAGVPSVPPNYGTTAEGTATFGAEAALIGAIVVTTLARRLKTYLNGESNPEC